MKCLYKQCEGQPSLLQQQLLIQFSKTAFFFFSRGRRISFLIKPLLLSTEPVPLPCTRMASGNGNYHYHVEFNGSESSMASPRSTGTASSSEDVSAAASSPKPRQSCLCSPTTHQGSFRCRLHRSSSNNWGKNPLPAAKGSHHTKSVEAL